MRTTVAIPLHRSLDWLEVIERNVRALADTAKIVVSDATLMDDALSVLADRLADVRGVTFVGQRDLEPGWIAHCNDLQARCNTEFFMWLPHDDEVGPEWITRAQIGLDGAPRAVMACGLVTRIDPPGSAAMPWSIEPDPRLAVESDLERRAELLDVLTVGDHAQLGLLFRSVQRTASSVPLPHVDEGHFADVAWAVQMVNRGPIVTIDATYRKRWYSGSAHSEWPGFAHVARVRSDWAQWAIDGLGSEAAISLLTQAWEKEHRLHVADRVAADAAWAQQLDVASKETERVRSDYESSRSWRATAPLRALSRKRDSGRDDPTAPN